MWSLLLVMCTLQQADVLDSCTEEVVTHSYATETRCTAEGKRLTAAHKGAFGRVPIGYVCREESHGD
jgi:hypothetical protein